jgi:hypothetical protein
VTGTDSVVAMIDGLGLRRLGSGDVGGEVADMRWVCVKECGLSKHEIMKCCEDATERVIECDWDWSSESVSSN